MHFVKAAGILVFAMVVVLQLERSRGAQDFLPNDGVAAGHEYRSSSLLRSQGSLKDGVFMRRARATNVGDVVPPSAPSAVPATNGSGNGNGNGSGSNVGGNEKRNKNNNNNNNNKKLSKISGGHENAPISGTPTHSTEKKQHSDKKVTPMGGSSNSNNGGGGSASASNHHQHGETESNANGNGNGSNNNNNNNKRKQPKDLPARHHRSHGKRTGGTKSAEANNDKVVDSGEKSQSSCRYVKNAWSDCDTVTGFRTRILTLKKDKTKKSDCEATRTKQKKCKKACRYEKGTWSECADDKMKREDTLLPVGSIDSSECNSTRTVTRKCSLAASSSNKGGAKAGANKNGKNKGGRRAQQA